MEIELAVLKTSPLFMGISGQELSSLLSCLSPRTKNYHRDDMILRMGDHADALSMVLSGSVLVVEDDFWGNRNIVAHIGPGEVFAETYACLPSAALGVGAVAAEDTRVLFLNIRRVLTTCSASCLFHERLIRNLLSTLAQKNLYLNQKLRHMARRSTREKLLSYLSAQAMSHGSPRFDIPFNRQQLADYLSVDRSAMSSELGKMQKEGLLQYDRNHFMLTGPIKE